MNETEHNSSCIAQNVEIGVFLFMGLGIFVICFLGIIGNLLSTIVLLKSQLKSSVNPLLIGLTFCDTIVILYSIATFAVPNVLGFFKFVKGYNHYLFPLAAPYLLPIALTGQTGSVYFTVAVTIERYVVVCWPLYAKHWCTKRRARFYTITVFVFSILFNITRWLEIRTILIQEDQQYRHNVKENNNSKEDSSCYIIEMTKLRKDIYYAYYYVNWMYLIFMYVIPFLILAILNTSIYKHIKWANASRLRMTLTRSQNRENSIAQMLVSVVVVFLICNILAMVNNALYTFWKKQVPIIINLSNFLVTFNSCCNFAIYYIFGQKFRKSFIGIWNGTFSCCQLVFKPPNGASSCRSTELETLK